MFLIPRRVGNPQRIIPEGVKNRPPFLTYPAVIIIYFKVLRGPYLKEVVDPEGKIFIQVIKKSVAQIKSEGVAGNIISHCVFIVGIPCTLRISPSYNIHS